MPDQPKSHFDRFLRPILASRFITISALIHLLIIVMFGGKVLFDRYAEPPDFQPTGEAASAAPASLPPPPPDVTLPPADTSPTSAPPPPPAPSLMVLATLNQSSASTFAVQMPAIPPPTIGKQFSQATTQTFGNGPMTALPAAMAGRGDGRDSTGEHFGMKKEDDENVLRALRWLQSQQQSDGTWGSEKFKGAFTGLALLCFLGHGETPQHSAEFSVVVTNAINALVKEGNENQGCMTFRKNQFADQDSPYVHAIGTYALCESYTMTKDPRLEPLVRQAVDYIVKGQRADGGWSYRYDTTPDVPKEKQYKSDTSVSGWQIQALKAAHLTGIAGMEQVKPVLNNAMKNIDRVFSSKDGSFGYRLPYDRKGNLTGVGVLAKLFWLGRADDEVRAGLKNITSKELDYHSPDFNFYAWYYDTQACFQAQGSAWDWWNSRFQTQLTSQQSSDGSWPPLEQKTREPGGMAAAGGGDGPLYRTTLCCLMLEVFYRYLPTSQDSSLSGSGNVDGL